MGKILENLKPETLWRNFEDICGIPRPSGKEQKITAFIKNFGEKHGIQTMVDEAGNVIFKKPATKGMEKKRTLLLQAHLDMVPQKNSDVKHNFETDPIQPRIQGDCVYAKEKTTLGSDNGIGVAAILSVFESKDLVHGPIEALFTVDEEAGMTGANKLKPGLLEADILFNLDSEDEGEFCVGCAGGMDTKVEMNYPEKPLSKDSEAFEVLVKGLKGGHSGVDIHLGRANSNKVLGRLLWTASRDIPIQISTFEGGNLRNAIPREATGIVAVSKNQAAAFQKSVEKTAAMIQKEFLEVDPDVTITIRKTELPAKAMDETTSRKFLNAIYAAPHGTFAMIPGMPNVSETSTNLSIVNAQNGKLSVTTMQRSSSESKRDNVGNMVMCAFELMGADVCQAHHYPGWEPNFKSPVLKMLMELYEKKFNKAPKIVATHGGLECGIIRSKYPSMDAISLGPTIRYPHSPDEHVEIPSVQKFWDFLVDVLKNIPNR